MGAPAVPVPALASRPGKCFRAAPKGLRPHRRDSMPGTGAAKREEAEPELRLSTVATDPFYLPTVKSTVAPVFPHPTASLPPASVMSTNPIESWSWECGSFATVIGARTTSNFGS